MMAEQKATFSERLNRISAGQQFEHEDLVGLRTQKRFVQDFGNKPKRPKRTFVDYVMIPVAFAAGALAVLLGRLTYFHLVQFSGLPEAFYDLGGRGMVLFAMITAIVMILIFQLATRSRMQSLALGFALMHFGEAAVASTAPAFWADLFSADYVAAVSSGEIKTAAVHG